MILETDRIVRTKTGQSIFSLDLSIRSLFARICVVHLHLLSAFRTRQGNYRGRLLEQLSDSLASLVLYTSQIDEFHTPIDIIDLRAASAILAKRIV